MTDYTLAERIGAVDSLTKIEKKIGIRVSDIDIGAEKERILREFFGDYPISREVYNGDDSFEARVKPILDLHKRTKTPRLDKEFDVDVQEDIFEMNSVGADAHLDSRMYTTKGVRYFNSRSLKIIPVASLLMGAAGYLLGETTGAKGSNLPAIICAGVGFVIPIAIGIGSRYPNTGDLRALERSAQHNDEYLRRLSREFGEI